MDTTSIGRAAEKYVATQLVKQGYKLLDQNWRSRWCEVDLIMTKKSTVYFIEVKYRKNGQYGSGLEYITTKKLQQMQFGAEYWLSINNWGGQSMLACVEVAGALNEPIEIIELT